MSDGNDQIAQKPTIVDTSSFNFKRNKKNRNHHRNSLPQEIDPRPVPIEMRPVIESIISYGKKMNALGELGAAQIMTDAAKSIRNINVNDPLTKRVLDNLATDLDRKSEATKLKFENAYDEIERPSHE